jgi:Tfp pilus assembly protein PilO
MRETKIPLVEIVRVLIAEWPHYMRLLLIFIFLLGLVSAGIFFILKGDGPSLVITLLLALPWIIRLLEKMEKSEVKRLKHEDIAASLEGDSHTPPPRD